MSHAQRLPPSLSFALLDKSSTSIGSQLLIWGDASVSFGDAIGGGVDEG